MYTPFQKFLPKAAGKYNFTRQLKAIEICQEYRKIAPLLFSPTVLEHSFPKSYENHVLTIGVYDSLWAGQLAMQKHLIQAAINEKFGADAVSKITFHFCEKKAPIEGIEE